MAFSFNGTTVTFTPAIGEVRSVTFDETGAEIDVTNATSNAAIFEAGKLNATMTVEINGDTTATIGTTAALSVVWNSGATDSMTTGVVTNKSVTGSVDTGITSTLTFKAASAA